MRSRGTSRHRLIDRSCPSSLLSLFVTAVRPGRARRRLPPPSAAPSRTPSGARPARRHRHREQAARPACREPTSPAPKGASSFAQLPPGAYELRAELAGFKPHVRPRYGWPSPQSLALNITLAGRRPRRSSTSSTGATPSSTRRARSSATWSRRRQIEQLPLNGRNYTDLALLQPGVLRVPHRDGGSVVAHGLGMSVNGQDPRVNVYLLDGTLLNDFTNGPAGSAAGTALGMDTVREFRVETNAYSAEFGRNCRRADQRADQVGHQPLSRQRLRVPPQRRARREELLRRRAASRTSRATSSAAPSAARSRPDRLFFFVGYEGLRRASRADDLDGRARRQRAARHPADRQSVGVNPAGRAVPARVSRAPNGPSLGQGLARLQLPVRSDARPALRAGPRRLQPRRQRAVLRAATPSTTRTSSCRPTIRSSRASSCRATSSSPASTGRCSRPNAVQHGAPRLQPHARRPERRGQHLAAARRRSCRAARSSATSTSAA